MLLTYNIVVVEKLTQTRLGLPAYDRPVAQPARPSHRPSFEGSTRLKLEKKKNRFSVKWRCIFVLRPMSSARRTFRYIRPTTMQFLFDHATLHGCR